MAASANCFADYRWSGGDPVGVDPLGNPTGKEHFRFLDTEGGLRVEQFDAEGKFVRLIHCPEDRKMGGTTYETSEDGRHKVRRSDDGAVRSYEEYEWPGGVPTGDVYPEARVYNEHGRLIAHHRPTRISDTAWDIHVLDALGKPRVILHHTDVDGSEPCTIVEEWLE